MNIGELWEPPRKIHIEKVNLEGAYFEMKSKRSGVCAPFVVTSVTVITVWDTGSDEDAETDAVLEYVRSFADLARDYRGTIKLSELTDPEMAEGFEFVMPAWLESLVMRGTPRL